MINKILLFLSFLLILTCKKPTKYEAHISCFHYLLGYKDGVVSMRLKLPLENIWINYTNRMDDKPYEIVLACWERFTNVVPKHHIWKQ